MTVGVLIISDRASSGERPDETLPLVTTEIENGSFQVTHSAIIPDHQATIEGTLIAWSGLVNIVLTSGGTGLSPRDVTPEATKAVIEKDVPGLAEFLRWKSTEKSKYAYLSRGIVGIRDKTIIVNCPGSPSGTVDFFHWLEPLFPHIIKQLSGISDTIH